MLESFNKKFEYKRLTEAEQKQRGILGRLIGPCADFLNPTRNGRSYSEQLWENVFDNELMQEKIANRMCLGELGHPTDRTDIDLEKAAICLAERPKKGDDGKLYAVFDILNTPNGKILKALCDYGCKVGISSRAQGDIITNYQGEEEVDPDTFDCECFDVVVLPGVKEARLKYVTEGLDNQKYSGLKKLKKTLLESLNSVDIDERRIMKETLKNLNININEEAKEEKVEETAEERVDKEVPEKQQDESEKEEVVENEEIVSEEDVNAEEENPAEEDKTEEDAPTDLDTIEETPDETSTEADLNEDQKQEIVIDWLNQNFTPEQVAEACKVLGVEIVDEEAEAVENNGEADDKEASVEEAEKQQDSNEVEETEENIEKSDTEEPEEEVKDEDKALDEGLDKLLTSLQESLKNNSDLEAHVKKLQEELAVNDVKVNTINEECNRYKKAITRLSMAAKSTKELNKKISTLEESVKEKDAIIENQKTRIARLVESRKTNLKDSTTLSESLDNSNNKIKTLNEEFNSLKSDYNEKTKLCEELETKEKEQTKQINLLTENLTKATTLKESYKKLANKTVNKYIEIKAEILGLGVNDIKRKLGESYTLTDVDQVCDDLKSYALNVSQLPFDVNKKVGIKIQENNSKPIRSNQNNNSLYDDSVDDSLIRLANCKF